jgi:hypothetical protein
VAKHSALRGRGSAIVPKYNSAQPLSALHEIKAAPSPPIAGGLQHYNQNQLAEQQSKYNEANILQTHQEQTEKQMHNFDHEYGQQ